MGRGGATLNRAALRVSCEHLPPELRAALRIVRERATQGRLLVLRLLQAEPLQLIGHLSVQEYYTARAICRGRSVAEPPWQWTGWWANVLRLGNELGEQFGHGLLRASGVSGELLDLRTPHPIATDPPLQASLRA